MDFAMGWNRFNLSLLGVWPEPRPMSITSKWIASLTFWTTATISFAFIVVPQTANLFLESASLDEVIENLSINTPIALALAKQIVLRYHEKAMVVLLTEVLDDWSGSIPERNRETMLKHAKLSRMISIACSTVTYVMVFTFIALQVWSNMQNSSQNDLGGLLHPAIFPYDVKKSPNFEITWIGQFIGTIATAIIYSCFDTFVAVLMLHICGQLSVLRTTLENLAETTKHNNFSIFQRHLGFIVSKHNQLYRFAVTVENCFNLTLLVNMLVCTAMFCMTGYRMITLLDEIEKDIPVVGLTFYVIHVFYTMVHLFIYCYVGEILLSESSGIAESAYACNWYNLPPKKALGLMLIIARGRISFQITAGKFSPFSLALFNTVLRTSTGYLSVLLAMKDRLVDEE